MPRYDKSQKDWQKNVAGYERCPDCDGWKTKKAYRCRSCSPRILEAAHARWNPDAKEGTKRKRARAIVRNLGDRCSRCDQVKPLERHHADGDTGNNDVSNISILCRRCHMEVDGRLEKFRQLAPFAPQPAKPCVECGKFSTGKYLRRGWGVDDAEVSKILVAADEAMAIEREAEHAGYTGWRMHDEY